MLTKQRILRILSTTVFVIIGLMALNHSLYSFWLAGGPPSEYPEAWIQQGITSWWQAVALITAGILCQLSLAFLRKSWIVRVVALLAVLGLVYPFVREFLLIDSCLDRGGMWLDDHFRCKNAQQSRMQ